MSAPTTTAETTVVLVLDEPSATESGRCPECFGWGFTWLRRQDTEPTPGPDCHPCHGTGTAW
ncbi:hypothetical protein GCM10009663_35330 [Kitasatospora arboriphila]|uniref:Uncharacterized protein n=1 Tax=Kitasatospora arboriphila TaxID=258052 RepID=A0ABP4E292_9ACTN